MKRRRVFVSGPVGGQDGRLDRIQAAIAVADDLQAAGFFPFVPHLFHFWDEQRPHDYEFWMAHCFAWLDVCDAVYRMPGESPGADREVMRALEAGIPVFTARHELIRWAK